MIAIIRGSEDTATARSELMTRFDLSERQANAILEMRLRSLTALERQRVLDELAEIRAKIAELQALLASDEKILDGRRRGARGDRGEVRRRAPHRDRRARWRASPPRT